ncbi:MAG: hypothetical protein ACREOG_11580 [Gemmatimonadaceae bacterium]
MTSAGGAGTPDSVGSLAQLYLGNILFALERCALSLETDGKRDDAAFYRGIARQLAAAHGRERPEVKGQRSK